MGKTKYFHTDTLEPLRILAIVAGTNEPSNSNVLADAFLKGIRTEIPEAQIEKIRLRDLTLDHFTLQHYDPNSCSTDDFCKTQDAILNSHGMLIATPVWNFSVPAHLKNFIDRMGSIALDQEMHAKGQLKNKPFFFIFTGGAPKIAWKALLHITSMHLSEAIKYYQGSIAGKHFEPKCILGRGKFGLVVDKRPESLAAMEEKGRRFARVVATYEKTGKLPFWLGLRTRVSMWIYRIGNRVMYPISALQ
jgi:multimeric flavodoxin WrbA